MQSSDFVGFWSGLSSVLACGLGNGIVSYMAPILALFLPPILVSSLRLPVGVLNLWLRRVSDYLETRVKQEITLSFIQWCFIWCF
ncbi:hypothetical protein F2Q70_00010989 [Brassica cretica]|uniref:Uncharacterized protein n=1 Tax=Brassica cretica TaxID=69181 RepID=A0A8S9M885_BRACR|nr:hypothetical protein F2Q70_00010989 [Brassica cretica]KAF3543309.1 hypothetical protein DY000_02005998 [Brassica cretica]